MNLIDLHVHSTASDGLYTPEEIVYLAKNVPLRAISITDHDTIDGLVEAIVAGKMLNIEVIPGLEISTCFENNNIHILGYFLDFKSNNLEKYLNTLKIARSERNNEIVFKLNMLGIPITMRQIELISGKGQIGRLHIARAMLKSGYVNTLQQAFDIYLKNGGKAYVEKFSFSFEETINIIKKVKGIPVLAHPHILFRNSDLNLRDILIYFKNYDLAGIEVFYADHTEKQKSSYFNLAKELNLLVTGGSDFHGLNKSEISLGNIHSRKQLTYDIIIEMKLWRQAKYNIF